MFNQCPDFSSFPQNQLRKIFLCHKCYKFLLISKNYVTSVAPISLPILARKYTISIQLNAIFANVPLQCSFYTKIWIVISSPKHKMNVSLKKIFTNVERLDSFDTLFDIFYATEAPWF